KYPDSDIAIMEIANLYKNTRILEHIGLGRFYGRPIIYIDKSLKGKEREKILQHAYDEITGWDEERQSLGLEWPQMREQILQDYEKFKKIAGRIHSKSNKIDAILKKYEAEHTSDLLTVIASMPFKEGDVVIAAGNKPLENLKWPFEIPKIDYIAHGKSYFLKSRYSKGAFYIGLTNKAIEDLDKLKRIAERNKKFETGAFGIGLVSSNYRFIVIERLVLPRKVKFVQKSTDLASDEQLEFMAGDADVLVEPNGVYYTTKYREYAQRQGRIVIEAHSHLPHTNTLKTKGRWPTESDMQALRRGIIPVGGIIHNEGYTFYHVSQNDEEIAGNTIPDLPSRKRHFLFGSPQSVFYKLQKYPGQPKTRKYIAKALGRSMLTIEPDLRFLVSAGLLIQEGRGEKATYVINPELSKNPALITRIQNILDTEFKVLKTGWENKVKIREMIFEEALKDNLYLAPVLKPMRNARDQI
nr:hypothetical protein [Candidatus Omnitrophota bacterium]